MDYTGFRPQGADEHEPALDLNSLLIRLPQAAFFAVMHGNAMARAGIRHNDLLIIEAAEQYRSGQIVLVYTGQEALVRRLVRTTSGFTLEASHPHYPTRPFDQDDHIRGRIVAAITLLEAPRLNLPLAS